MSFFFPPKLTNHQPYQHSPTTLRPSAPRRTRENFSTPNGLYTERLERKSKAPFMPAGMLFSGLASVAAELRLQRPLETYYSADSRPAMWMELTSALLRSY